MGGTQVAPSSSIPGGETSGTEAPRRAAASCFTKRKLVALAVVALIILVVIVGVVAGVVVQQTSGTDQGTDGGIVTGHTGTDQGTDGGIVTGMFAGCHNTQKYETEYGPVSKWNIDNVADLSGMFSGCGKFNKALDWDTSGVTDMMYVACYTVRR